MVVKPASGAVRVRRNFIDNFNLRVANETSTQVRGRGQSVTVSADETTARPPSAGFAELSTCPSYHDVMTVNSSLRLELYAIKVSSKNVWSKAVR